MTHPRLSAWNDVFGSIADATSLLTAMELGVFETLHLNSNLFRTGSELTAQVSELPLDTVKRSNNGRCSDNSHDRAPKVPTRYHMTGILKNGG